MDVRSGKHASATKNNRLTLLVLVDALRPDYLARAPYLKHLAASGATGVLRECFGFVPRAAYFGGLDAEQYGFTNMYCFDPAGSPFGLARTLPASPAGAMVEAQAGVRQFLEQSARERMAPFARSYGSSAEIPLRFLPFFDLVEKRSPWEKQAGYRSLFALLDEKEIAWYQCSWPETNKLSDRSDEGIVNHVLEEMRPEHRFAYVHLQELDSIGHAFGPQSAEMQKHIAATDGRCQRLIETLRQRYDRLDLVLFGDHGMVNVTRTLDVWEALNATGLKFGIDYAFFLDSTMARLWFYHARAREQAQQALSALQGGRLLQPAELSHYGIAGCDSRNAEMIFLADPGVLIFPNFFQGHGEPIKGMHGYDPDCPDNLGFFLLHGPGLSHLSGSSIGKVDPPELFPLLLELLDLTEPNAISSVTAQVRSAAVPSPSSPESLRGAPSDQGTRCGWGQPLSAPEQLLSGSIRTTPATPKGRFTTHPDPAADEMVRLQLDQITKAIEARFGQPKAVVLTGSFGRGEGGVFRDASGSYRPVNDYDILVLDYRDLGPELKKLGDELARELRVDYIDLGCSDGHWEQLPLSVMHYDLKYGSQVIAGDPGVLDRIPAYAAADIAVWEAIKLLLNRSAGLLTGLRGEFLLGAEPKPEAKRYLTNQIAKALMAIGDWHLIRWECYDSSYRLRAERFRWLAPGAGLDAALVRKICQAYEFKCLPNYELFADGLKAIAGFYPDVERALIQSVNLHTESHAKDLSRAMTIYLESMSADAAWVAADNALCSAHPEIKPMLKPGASPGCSLRHLVYSVLPFLVTAASDPKRAKMAFAEIIARLEPFFQLPEAREFSGAAWEDLRALVVKAWFAICH